MHVDLYIYAWIRQLIISVKEVKDDCLDVSNKPFYILYAPEKINYYSNGIGASQLRYINNVFLSGLKSRQVDFVGYL